jgi:hypothetical protein
VARDSALQALRAARCAIGDDAPASGRCELPSRRAVVGSLAMSLRPFVLGAISTVAAACGNVGSPIDAAPTRDVQCGAQPVEVLPNGSFDAPSPPWAQDPVTPSLLCGQPLITPFDGTESGCLGSTDGTIETLSQTIPLPVGVKTLTLSGEICIDTKETDKVDNDILQFDVVDGAATVAALGKQTNQQGVVGCQFTAFELTGAASSDPVSATLRLRSTLNTSNPTTFYIDKLSLKAACM